MSAAAGKAACHHEQFTTHTTPLGVKMAMCTYCGKSWQQSKYNPGYTVDLGCKHVSISYQMENGEMGTRCSQCDEWLADVRLGQYNDRKQKAPAPTKYLKRTSKHVDKKCRPHWVDGEWDALAPANFYDAEMLMRQWNTRAECDGVDVQYQLPLYCHRCFKSNLTETFAGNVCSDCKGKPMICTRCSRYTAKPKQFNGGGALCNECYENSVNFALKKAKANGVDMTPFKQKPTTVKRQNGDFWPIPASNAPVGAKQWGYQGSGKTPYIITQYATKRDGAVTVDGWACSCPNFTRNTPRDHCKHIIKIMVSEGITPGLVSKAHTKTLQAVVGASDAQLEAFQKWQKEQAENKPKKAGDVVLNDDIMSQGRKFR